MNRIILCACFAGGLFLGVLICLRVGWHLGRRRFREQGESGLTGLGALEGAVYGLMGLLIAFTFTGAAGRFDARRDLITQHVNAMGTAWLRLDLLSPPARSTVQALFRRYVDTQLELSRNLTDPNVRAECLARLNTLQNQIWTNVTEAIKTDKSLPLPTLLLPPINEMFDLTTTRLLSSRQHPPMEVFALLGFLVLVSGFMAGFGMAKTERQSLLHLLGFATVLGLSVYFILDLEFPRLGLVRIDSFDAAVIELRATMN